MSCYPIYNDSFWNLPLIVVSEWKMCTRTFIERYCSQILESLKMQTKSNSVSPLELVLVLPTRRKLNYTISKTVQQTAAAASVWSVQLACPCPSTSAGLFLSLAEQFEAQDPRGSREGTHSQYSQFLLMELVNSDQGTKISFFSCLLYLLGIFQAPTYFYSIADFPHAVRPQSSESAALTGG